MWYAQKSYICYIIRSKHYFWKRRFCKCKESIKYPRKSYKRQESNKVPNGVPYTNIQLFLRQSVLSININSPIGELLVLTNQSFFDYLIDAKQMSNTLLQMFRQS